MICDLHSHIVFGVDDGAKDETEARKMIDSAFSQGVTEIVCTSHTIPGYTDIDKKAYLQNFSRLQEYIYQKGYDMQLFTASEIMYTSKAAKLLRSGEVFTIADTSYVLIEFQPFAMYNVIRDAVMELNDAGYHPILAHIERYQQLQEQPERLHLLKTEGFVYYQMNANTVLRTNGLFSDKWSRYLLANGLVDIIASDAHNMNDRGYRLEEVEKQLSRKFGDIVSRRMCFDMPHSICHK